MELFCPSGLAGKELVSVWPGAPGTRFDSSQHPCGYIAGISDDGSRKGHPWLRLLFQRVSDAQFIVDVWVSPCDICQDDLGVVDGLGDIPYDRLIVVDFIRA